MDIKDNIYNISILDTSYNINIWNNINVNIQDIVYNINISQEWVISNVLLPWATRLLQLSDTPSSYKDSWWKILSIKDDELWIEFIEMPTTNPAWDSTEIQYNDSWAFWADSWFVRDKVNKRLGVGIDTPQTNTHIFGTNPKLRIEDANNPSTIARFQIEVDDTNVKMYAVNSSGAKHNGVDIFSMNLNTAAVGFGGTGTFAFNSSVLQLGNNAWRIKGSSTTGFGIAHTTSGKYGFSIINNASTTDIFKFDFVNGATFTAPSSTFTPLIFKGTALQSANLTEWQDDIGTVLSVVDATGNIGIKTPNPTAPLDIDWNTLRLRQAKTPISASDTGNQWDIAWDSDYVYICVATNTWKRAGLATW